MSTKPDQAQVEQALGLLQSTPNFGERIGTLKGISDHDQFWAKWNEIRSAASFSEAGIPIAFSPERGASLAPAPEFTFVWGELTVGVEVATVSDTRDRRSIGKRFHDEIVAAVNWARRRGVSGAFGGVVPLPERFEGGWSAVKKLKAIKSGSRQSQGLEVRILHMVTNNDFLQAHDFLPDAYHCVSSLRYRYSGRIYNAYYGIEGQTLFWHHFIGHSVRMSRTTSTQAAAGRFVDPTSLSAAIWTMHESSNDGSAALSSLRHVIYCPLAGAGSPMPNELLDKLDTGFRFDRALSVVPSALDTFTGPHGFR